MSDGTPKVNLWITESLTPYDLYSHGVVKVLAYKRTAFQEMCIVECGTYGKGLVLDGRWQSSVGDEFLYHESLVHPACIYHGTPRNVLVLGGAEGAALREVLKWKSVERVVMVDIDGEVVEACREHLPEMHQGAFDDPRTELVIADAQEYVEGTHREWDVIVSDLSDPIEEGPALRLFTREFFLKCRRALTDKGYFSIQAGSLAPPELPLHARLVNTAQAAFAHVAPYGACVPTYGVPLGFVLAGSREIDPNPDPSKIDAQLKEKTRGSLRYLDGATLLGILHPPKHIRAAIAAETGIFTLNNPPQRA